MDGLLSIIVLTYYSGDCLFSLLDSIFKQTYPKIELVLTDDGTDSFDYDTINNYIIKNKKKNIKNYLIIHGKENVGTVKNINRGIDNSKGEYIKIIGGDDYYPDERIFEEQIVFLTKHPEFLIVIGEIADCSYATGEILYRRGAQKANELREKVFSMDRKQKSRYCFKHRIAPYTTQAMCFRKQYFDIYGKYDENYKLIEDSSMASRLIDEDIKIGIIKKCVVAHRINSGVSSNNNIFDKRKVAYYEDIRRLFLNNSRKETDLFWKFCYYNRAKMAEYRIAMSLANGRSYQIYLSFRYVHQILFYIFLNFRSILDKVNDKLLKA